MVRLLKVLVLWGAFSVAGFLAVAMVAFGLAVVFRSEGLNTAFLVLGLASVLPVSLAVADNVVPRPRRGAWPSVSCPHCGAPFGPGSGPKPDPGLWPFL